MSALRDNRGRGDPALSAAADDSPALNLAAIRERHPRRGSRVWLWIFAAFALQLTAWTIWFVIASRNRVAEVPLAEAIGNRP